MANKPAPRKWNDIQVAIATISMALTLGFWNLFASPDRVSAAKHAQEQAMLVPSQPVQAVEPAVVQPTAQQLTDGKILLGGSAPQTQIIVQGGGGGNNNGGAASGGGTGSS